MSTFIAAYHGTCPGCGDPIKPGDECTYVRTLTSDADEVWHLDCSVDAPIPARPEAVPEVCGTCFLTRPCDCETAGGWAS